MVRETTRSVGQRAERYAERFLLRQGLQLLKRNYHCRYGEIDLIMRDAACLVFVEVRYRSIRRISSARNTVNARKQQKLIKTAALFLAAHPRYANCVSRFDVLGLEANADGAVHTDWLKDAFRPDDSYF